MGLVRNIGPYLQLVGMGLLIFLAIGLGLELLATINAKARDLRAKSRFREVVYLTIPLALAIVLFAWVFWRFRH